MKLGPWALVSLYGEIRELWKTRWIYHDLGSWSLQLTPQEVNTLNGQGCLGASLALGYMVWTLVPLCQTKSSGLKLWVAIGFLELFMTSAVTFSAAVTLDLT